MSNHSEAVRLSLYKEDECWVAQYVVAGHKCLPFFVHESTRRQFHNEEAFLAFLEHKACEMLELYGPVN